MIKFTRSRLGQRLLALILSLAVVLTAVPCAGAVTQAEINKKKEQQAQLQDDIDELDSAIKNLKKKENSAMEQIQLYQQQMDALVGQINASQAFLAELEGQIAVTQEELQQAQDKATQYYQLFCERVRDLEEMGSISYWTILFSAASFSDLLDRINFVGDVMRYDNNMVNVLDDARQAVADKEAQLKDEQAVQEEALADLEKQYEAVEVATANTEALVKQIQEDRAAYADKLDKLEEQEEELAKEISDDEDDLRWLQQQQQNQNQGGSSSGGSSGGSASVPPPSVSGTGLGADIAKYACQFVGKLPYVWGGTSLTSGADCSGFVQAVFKQFGVYLPRTAAQQATCGTAVSYENAQPGDLIYYRSGASASGSHIGIYIGNGKYVNAVGANYGTQISIVNLNKPGLTFRRVV